jgi:lipoprotein-releasing system permease protein
VRGIERNRIASQRGQKTIRRKFDLKINARSSAGSGCDARLAVGDVVNIHSPANIQKMRKHRGKEEEEAYLPSEFTVNGIFDVGYYEYNASIIVCSLANAQDLYDLNNSVHGLLVMLHDPFRAEDVRMQLHQLLGPEFLITTWSEENSAILNALLVEKNVMFYLLLS